MRLTFSRVGSIWCVTVWESGAKWEAEATEGTGAVLHLTAVAGPRLVLPPAKMLEQVAIRAFEAISKGNAVDGVVANMDMVTPRPDDPAMTIVAETESEK